MILYDQRVAERFGADVRKNIRGALHPNLDTKLRDLHIQAAYDDARIAFHFAALVLAWGDVGLSAYQQLVKPLQ